MDRTIEGKIYINGTFESCCLGITQGKISEIKKTLKSDDHISFGSKLILPAGIDLHVHFRDPGFPKKEDFSSGSKAAAYGGISCVYDMPNTNPQTITVEAIREKKKLAEKKSYVDFGLYAAITDTNINQAQELGSVCNGFKIFLGASTNTLHLNERNLQVAFEEIMHTKKVTLIHAESETCLQQHKIVERNLKDHVQARPSECEVTAIKNILTHAKQITTPVHICHLSSLEGFELLRRRPAHITVGVTPHHLYFDCDTITGNETWYKVNPPLRSGFDRETLWYGIKNNSIDVLESDHAPHTLTEKETEFDKAPSGIPGVETMYPLLLAEVKKDALSFRQMISLLCERPAQILGIPKGKIEIGGDADFIVIDFKKLQTIHADALHSKCGWTPFEGMPALFPMHVFVRGEQIIDDYTLVGKPGYGTCIGESQR
ncbi:MAG: dihydroorotase [Candidatus Thermoplasmatota archaeon]